MSKESGYSRATLMDLATWLPDVPGIDMLVNLPEKERVLDLRVAELCPKAGDATLGRPERGVLCSTDRRMLFFLRPTALELDRELLVATGYLVESLLLDQPLDRERAARFFPKKSREVLDLRARLAKVFFPDLQPVLCLPLAGVAAFMYHEGENRLAMVDLEVDLRAEGQELRAAIPQNPQLRLILGPRFVAKPYPKPDPNLPLIGACEVAEMVRLVDDLRNAQAAIDYDHLPARLFRAPWAIAQLSFAPRPRVEVVYRGERMSGAVYLERGELCMPRKLLGHDVLFNVGEVDLVTWDEGANALVIKGPGMHHRWKVESPGPEFHWLRNYLVELVEVKHLIWELPGRAGMAPDAKQDPVGGLLCYHLETCNDPAVILPARIAQEQVEEFMEDFGQLLPAEETPQGMILLIEVEPHQEGVLFTDRALYARRVGQTGVRIPYSRLEGEMQTKKGLVSTQLTLGPVQLSLSKLGKETVTNLFQLLRALPKLSR